MKDFHLRCWLCHPEVKGFFLNDHRVPKDTWTSYFTKLCSSSLFSLEIQASNTNVFLSRSYYRKNRKKKKKAFKMHPVLLWAPLAGLRYFTIIIQVYALHNFFIYLFFFKVWCWNLTREPYISLYGWDTKCFYICKEKSKML